MLAYIKQNFSDGDVLYASQLNAMDAQIALNETMIVDIYDVLVNATEYGLSTAAADNSPALLAAIQAATLKHVPVFLPAGTYILASPIVVPDSATIYLVGVANAFAASMNRELVGTEYHAKESGTTLIYRGEGSMFMHKGAYFSFKNITFANQNESKRYLYNARVVGQVTVDSSTKGKIYAENCLFAGWKTVAGDTYITDDLESVLGGTLTKPETLEQCCIVASRCRFSFCGSAFNMGVDSRLDDCSINKCYYGVSFYGAAGFSALANCRIEWCLFDGVLGNQAHHITVTGCEFDRCGHAAIRLTSCTSCNIVGNMMRRNGADPDLTADAATRNIHLYINGCTGGTITGNSTVAKNISDDGSSTTVRPVNAYNIKSNSNMVISGNDFTGCTTGTYNRYTDNTECRTTGNLGFNDIERGINFIDLTTGTKYVVCVDNGKLTMEEITEEG